VRVSDPYPSSPGQAGHAGVFVGPLNHETAVLPHADLGGKLPNAVHCICQASPWCDGPTGARWLDCDRACRSCNPRRRRRAMNTGEGDDAQAN